MVIHTRDNIETILQSVIKFSSIKLHTDRRTDRQTERTSWVLGGVANATSAVYLKYATHWPTEPCDVTYWQWVRVSVGFPANQNAELRRA
jgi:hypothetical protein